MNRDDVTPKSMSELVVVVHSGPDDMGRYCHTRLWLSDYNPTYGDGVRVKGQVFKAKLPKKSDKWPTVTYVFEEGAHNGRPQNRNGMA